MEGKLGQPVQNLLQVTALSIPYSRSITPNNFSSTAVKYGRFNSPRCFSTARAASSKLSFSRSLLMRSLLEKCQLSTSSEILLSFIHF
ncbi:MAG TPA: hypothetical protein VE956_18190 [Nodularia sp. (in: cyanobacteria)]|nr:hypothetical protein [Nodularia sp. (in: cyanobacteria)]